MKQEWSPKWSASSQKRKQRKHRTEAPLHARHDLVSAHLSKELRKEFKRRALPLRKGDEVKVMRGEFLGQKGTIERVDYGKLRVYVDTVKIKKVNGSEVLKSVEPSNVMITRAVLDDKRRREILERKVAVKVPEKTASPAKAPKTEAKPKEADAKQ